MVTPAWTYARPDYARPDLRPSPCYRRQAGNLVWKRSFFVLLGSSFLEYVVVEEDEEDDDDDDEEEATSSSRSDLDPPFVFEMDVTKWRVRKCCKTRTTMCVCV